MPPITLIAALAEQAAETAGVSEARLLSATVDQILTSASTLRVNSQVALALAERVSEMSNVISSIVLDAEGDDYDVRQLEAFATFKHALEEIQSAIQAQKDRSYFSALLHQQRDRNALAALSDKLHAAFDILMTAMRIQATAAVSARAADLDALAAKREAQLRAISTLPGPVYAPIPPAPQLQFGRADETQAVVDALTREDRAGRIAILGGPGIGKTTLAAAALHHPAVVDRFGARRFFVPCDAAEGRASCLTVITDAFGIVATTPSAALKGLEGILGGERAVLVLDNFESAWEGAEQRAAAEEVLAFLDGIDHLSVIVTMRGSERPQGMQWTRPFLEPLSPLSESAAKQVFLSIANVDEFDPGVDSLLQRLDNMPLALVLMANLAQYTPLPALLEQWDESATAMLVRGATSLDVSIDMSIRSPRMQAVPDAQTLLSVLALLPAGAMDTDVQTWSSDLSPRALGVLLLTALATRTADGRVHVLAPIRSFMWTNYRPSGDCVTSAVKFYVDLAGLASTAALNPEPLALISPELANIDSVIRFVLLAGRDVVIETTLVRAALRAVAHLYTLHRATAMGTAPELLPIACAAAERHGFNDLRARLLLLWGVLSYNGNARGDPADLYRLSYVAYERAGDTAGMIDSGRLLYTFLPAPQAVARLDHLFRLASVLDDPARMAKCAETLARALERAGRQQEAIDHYERAISITEQHPEQCDPAAASASLHWLGNIYMERSDGARAVEKFERALVLLKNAPFRNAESSLHISLGGTQAMRGHPARAVEHMLKAIAVHHGADFRHKSTCLVNIAEAHIALGNLDAATIALADVERLVPHFIQTPYERVRVLHASGMLAHQAGDLAEASALLRAACDTARRTDIIRSHEGMMRCTAESFSILSGVAKSAGKTSEAAIDAVAAAVLFRRLALTMASAACLVHLSEVVCDDFAELLLSAVIAPLLRLGNADALARAFLRSAKIALRRKSLPVARKRASKALYHLRGQRDKGIIAQASLILSMS